jgi:hypothetical protein
MRIYIIGNDGRKGKTVAEPMVRRLAAGGDRIRTIGPARAPGAVVLVHADFSASAGEPT